jgi:hypothetical protein
MTKRMLVCLGLVAVLLGGCPAGWSAKLNGWGIASGVVQGAQIALGMAQAAFGIWKGTQTDTAYVQAMASKFDQYAGAVWDGLKLVSDGIALAREVKSDPDMGALMKAAEEAWVSLRQFLTDLHGKPSPAVVEATSLPAGVKATRAAARKTGMDNFKVLLNRLPARLGR